MGYECRVYSTDSFLLDMIGVFAGEALRKGTYIGIYSGEIITENEAHERGRYAAGSPPPILSL